jgi:hypothetical protein
MTKVLHIDTATKKQIIEIAIIETDLMFFLGGLEVIKERTIEDLRILTETYFALNTEVGAFYDKNGF